MITRTMARTMLAAVLAAAAAAPAATIWIEGENPDSKTTHRHGWYDRVKKDGMSGKEWLSHYHGSKAGEATYRFTAPAGGEYTFWWRGNTSRSAVSWSLNGGEFVEMDPSDKRGEYMISDKPDHRSLAWVKVGRVTLREGENTVTFRFHSKISNHGGVDCFVFDDTGFVPSGARKPGGGREKTVGPDKAIWIEGENPDEKSTRRHGWYDRVKKDGMSGKEWLSHYAREPGEATYRFDVEVADTYTLWWRGNPAAAKVSYALDGGEMTEMSFADRRGSYMISEKPDHRSLAWVKVGRFELDKGSHRITFRFHSGTRNHGGVDCFVFTRVPFVPSGANKPVEAGALGPAEPDEWFEVITDDDAFSPKSVIDMSRYVEAPAGRHGFVQAAGKDLTFAGSGEKVRFWGCVGNLRYGKFTREQMAHRARYLRKHGINMVRQHPVFGEVGPLRDGRLDPERIDAFDYWFAQLKKQGIYMTWSVFYPLLIGPGDGYPAELLAELPRAGRNSELRKTSGLVNVERELQDLQLRYLKVLLTHKNPYTGLRYVDDPALAVVEVHNEDCVFFHHPLNSYRNPKEYPLHSKRFRRRWASWVKEQYGSQAAVKKAWGRLRPRDDWDAGELEIMGAYHLQGEGPGNEFRGMRRRAGDYVRFLTELQRGFYERREKELREIGYKAVTITTAWRAGGAAADPANLYCDTACGMISRHNYMGGGAGGHSIAEGKVNNESHMATPGGKLLAVGMYQVEDKPFCVTEWTQKPPNQWKLEAAPLMAFYGFGLQGWDASYHFAQGRTRIGDGWPNLSSYVTDTPHYIGQFPALAFALYHGHIEEGPVVAARRLDVKDLFLGIDPLSQDFTGGGWDDKRLKGSLATPAEALAIGRVTVSFDGGKSRRADFGKYWDRDAKVVRSATGQLVWDYGRGVVQLRSEKTQAVIGRAGGQAFDLPGATVEVDTPFVSILLTPLDNRPLADSARVLVTAMARDKQTGTEYADGGEKLVNFGAPPLLMEPVQATLRLKGAAPEAVNVLDPYGVPTGRTVEPAPDGSLRIDGTHRTYYYEIRR